MEKRGTKPSRKIVEWSPELAYAIGLIATDGCLSKDGRHLLFVSKDLQQIKNVKNCLIVKAKISNHISSYSGKNTTYFHLQWGDVTLYKFLVQIGLTPNKSLTIGALKIPDPYFFEFLRGSYDGDGCFYSYFDPRWKNSYMFYIAFASASQSHILWLQQTIQRLISIHGHMTATGKNTTMYSLKFAKAETLILLAKMYPNQNVVSLDRKRLKIEAALSIVGKSLVAFDT